MQVGDLVKYNHPKWDNWYGLVVREIAGTEERMKVKWLRDSGVMTCTPKRDLDLISEGR